MKHHKSILDEVLGTHVSKVKEVSDGLSVTLEHVDRVDGRVPKVPKPEGGVSGGGYHQALGGVGAAVGQFLVMAWTHTHAYTDLFWSQLKALR